MPVKMQFRSGLWVLTACGICGLATALAPAEAHAQDEPPPAEPPAEGQPAPPAEGQAPPPAPGEEPKPAGEEEEKEGEEEKKEGEGAEGQAPPAPPPAAPPAPPPPAAPPPAAPPPGGGVAGAEAAPPAVSFSGAVPGADTPTPDEGEDDDGPEPLPWRGTSFTWNQAFTTTTVGIGRDNIGGDDEYYGWDFYLSPRYYLLDLEKDKIIAEAEIGWGVELTNSPITTEQRELQFRDLQVGAAYDRLLWRSEGEDAGEYQTNAGVRARLIFPTSPISSAQGRILTTALGVSGRQTVKILGKEAMGLNNITLGLGVTWSHLFSEAKTPVNGDLERPRQNASSRTFLSDQLTTASFDVDRIIPSFTWSVPVIQDLTFSNSWRLIGSFKYDFEDGAGSGCDVAIANDPCVQADRLEDRTTYNTITTFDVNLSYPILDVAGITLGYLNETGQLAPDGTRRGVFYSPDAQFYFDITANLDGIYSRATGRDEKKTAVIEPPASF